MTTTSTPRTGGVRARRTKYGLVAAVLIGATTASVVLVNLLAERSSVRLDLTATGEHRLAPRTSGLLARLSASYDFVLAGPIRDRSQVSPQALDRVRDMLDRFARQSGGKITVSVIDTGSSRGAEEHAAVIERLRAREAPEAARQSAALDAATAALSEIAPALAQVQQRLLQIREAITAQTPGAATNRAYLETRAGECAAGARALAELADRVRAARSSSPSKPADQIETIAATIRNPLSDLRGGLEDIASNLAKLAGDSATPPAARDGAQTLAESVRRIRDRAVQVVDELDRLPRLPSTRVDQALRKTTSLLVIGPASGAGSGIAAVPIERLLPQSDAAAADVGRNAEHLLSLALSSLVDPQRPIVVVVHGQQRGYFERAPVLDAARAQLESRGIDVVFWDTIVDADPPPLTRLNPDRKRPVVYMVVNTDSFGSGGRPGETSPERVKKLGAAVQRLAEEGRDLLVNAFPSTFPTFGEPDPTIAWLDSLGVKVDSARPLLRQRITPEGRRVEVAIRPALDPAATGPVAGAIAGLPSLMEWTVPIELTPAPGVAPLLRIEDADVWAESQWLSFMQIPIAQHAQVLDGPKPEAPRDTVRGPFITAATIERPAADRSTPQRIMVVGSNTWMTSRVLDEQAVVDGRVVQVNSGNLELLDAAISWLAHQDELIAAGTTSRAVALVREISAPTLQTLRWMLALGLPVGILAIGALWRWRRG